MQNSFTQKAKKNSGGYPFGARAAASSFFIGHFGVTNLRISIIQSSMSIFAIKILSRNYQSC